MSLFAKQDVAVDLGASRVRLLVRGRGIVLDESVSELVDSAAFTDAGRRLTALCRAAFKRAQVRTGLFSTVRVVATVPSSIDEVGKRIVEEALHAAGCRRVFLLESPMAAAIGAGEPVSEARASAVVDIGFSRIQVAVISLAGNVIVQESLLGPQTDASALSGRIADLVRSVLSGCLAKGRYNLADDVARGGLVLTGGGAMTPGLAEALKDELDLPIRQVDKPDRCVIEGAGVVLTELDLLCRTR